MKGFIFVVDKKGCTQAIRVSAIKVVYYMPASYPSNAYTRIALDLDLFVDTYLTPPEVWAKIDEVENDIAN